jgi:hypothetical protein
MQEFLVLAHEGWRWVVLLALLAGAVSGVIGYFGRKDWQPRSTTVARAMAIAYDIQVLLGLAVYGVERMWESTDPFFRSIHPATMLVGLVVVHVAVRRTRTGATSRARHMWLAGGAIVALLVAVAGGALGS